jgi:hypothetical protein
VVVRFGEQKQNTLLMSTAASIPKQQLEAPSSLYRAEFWRMGLGFVRFVPRSVCIFFSRIAANIYWFIARDRRAVVIQNIMPALNNDRAAATKKAK